MAEREREQVVSQRNMSLDLRINPSTRVFVRDETHGWVPATLLPTNSSTTRATVLIESSSSSSRESESGITNNTADASQDHRGKDTKKIRLADYPPKCEFPMLCSMYVVDDLVELPHVNEAGVLCNLQMRHARSLPYTRLGDLMLIAVDLLMVIYSLGDRRREGADD